MKPILFILFGLACTIEMSAQGITKYGQSVSAGNDFVDVNGKLVNKSSLDKNGQVLNIDWDLDMWMPDTIYLASGNTIKIYNDNVAYLPAARHNKINFTWTSAVGAQDPGGITFSNVPAGSYSIRVIARSKADNSLKDSAFTVIKVQPKANLGKKAILAIGNSLTHEGWQYMAKQIDDSLDVNLNSIGTHGSLYKNEGISGKTYQYFCIDEASPFTVSGINLNFKQYLITNALDTPDIIRLSLGINECYLDEYNDTILYFAKRIIDKIITDLPDTKIVISMPSTAANTMAGWIEAYGSYDNYEPYIYRMRILQKSVYSLFRYGVYNRNVDVAYDGFVIDRDDGYPKTDGVHTNGVHPYEPGYDQLIRGTLNVINHLYQ